MSFLATSGKSFAKETREEQFLRYFRDTGTSKVFQNALILLYKMPIKPTNLTEFFAEYFENGAQDLVKLSLLKAELCYKHAETQDMHQQIKKLEQELQQYELARSESILNTENPERFSVINEYIETEDEYDMFDRFFGDLDEADLPSPSKSSVTNMTNQVYFDDIDDRRYSSRMNLPNFVSEDDKEIENDLDDDEAICVVENDPQLASRLDSRALDPWGIVLNFQPHTAEEEEDHKEEKPQKSSKKNGGSPPEMSVIGSIDSLESEKNYKKYDSDDAETLAEMYQGLAVDAAREVNDQRNGIIADEGVKLLSVQKAPKISVGDLLGWKLPSSSTMLAEEIQANKAKERGGGGGRRDIRGDPSSAFSTFAWGEPSIGTYELFKTPQEPTVRPQHWSHFIDPLDEDEMETCEVEKEKNIFWLDVPRGVSKPIVNPLDDTYLLDAAVLQRMRSSGSGGFAYEFVETAESQKRLENDDKITNMCAKTCRVRKKVRVAKADAACMTDYVEDCLCEDCQCEDDGNGQRSYGPIIPGKMTNWTNDIQPDDGDNAEDCYYEDPGEDYELLGEDDRIICYKKKKSDDAEFTKEDMDLLDQLEDFIIPLSAIQSSCQCSDTSFNNLTKAKEECMRACISAKKGQPSLNQLLPPGKTVRKSNAKTMTMPEMLRADEIEKEKRFSVEPNLADVFKSPNPYGGGVEGKGQGDKGGGGRKSSLKKDKRGSDKIKKRSVIGGGAQGDDDGDKYVSDAYELDLNSEVKKRFGF